MKINLLPLSAILICTQTLHAQDNSEKIADWQKSHPEISFISQERLSSLPDSERKLLGSYIVFVDAVTFSDIEKYETSSGTAFKKRSDEDAEMIKKWITEHPEVEILPYSFHSSLNSQQREFLLGSNPMFLEGEFITVIDINNY